MARIRSIKPEFFSDEDVADLPLLVRLLFAGMWCHCDREGRLKDKPRTIKALVLPFDDIDIDAALEQLHEAGFIIRYRVQGVGYIQVRSWEKHQKPHHTERESDIPPRENGSTTVQEPLSNRPETEQSLDAPSPMTRNQRQETKNKKPAPPKKKRTVSFPLSLDTPEFRSIWKDWEKHRREIKKPLTAKCVELQVKKLADWGPERSIRALQHTIAMGWQGVREPELPRGSPGRNGPTDEPSKQQRLAKVLGYTEGGDED